MAKPKRYLAEEFNAQLDNIIERLIDEKKQQTERTDIRIEEIAQHFNVNVATLRRWCQEHTQKSPSQYLAEYRIEKAKHLLRQGVKPSVVSKMLVFTEHKVFCSVFKRLQCMTPSSFSSSNI